VGRDPELRALELRVLQAQEGQGSIVLLSGEPGIGKSRLVAELLSTVAARGCLCLEGRCYSLGKNLSYHPFVDLLRKWATIREEDGDTTSLAKLESAITAISPADAGDIFPFVARMIGLAPTGLAAERIAGIEGEALDNLVVRSARDLFARLAEKQPLLVVIEDLHWADESTLELLESVLGFAESKRICFLLTMRPDFSETSERLSAMIRERYADRLKEIVLTPLGTEDSGRLLDGIMEAGGVSARLRERIIGQSDGNPYFIEEVLHSFVDEGALVRGATGWEAVPGLDERRIPSTIQEVLMERIDRLDEKTRSLVRAASVIGRNFSYRILTDVARSIDEIDGKILHLTEIQLILKGQRLDEVEYLFKHALAQEVAYESILANKRRELHKAVAEAIERLFADRLGEFAGMLAWHYARAEDFERAEDYMIKAGAEAMKSAASSEALAYYQDAFELYKRKKGSGVDPAKVAMFETNIARALYAKGKHGDAVPHYDRALALLSGKTPESLMPRTLGAALGFLSLLAWLFTPGTGRKRPLTDAVREYVTLCYERTQMLIDTDIPRGLVEAFFGTRIVLRYEIAEFELGKEVLAAFSGAFSFGGFPLPLSRRWMGRVGALLDQPALSTALAFFYSEVFYDYRSGAWSRPGAYADPIAVRGIEQGKLYWVELSLYFESLGFVERGDWAKYEADVAMLNEIGTRFDSENARVRGSLLEVRRLVKQRRRSEALAAIPAAIGMMVASGFKDVFLPGTFTQSARAFILVGEFDKAEAEYLKATELWLSSKGSPSQESLLKGVRAVIAVERIRRSMRDGKSDRGPRQMALREGFAAAHDFLANSRKLASDRTEALKIMGSCHWFAGHRRRALRYWWRSIQEGERLGAKVELAHTLHDAGELLGTIEPGPEWSRRAAEVYEELGMGPVSLSKVHTMEV
jgi:tetratricopeptide (TPR) repeat protein